MVIRVTWESMTPIISECCAELTITGNWKPRGYATTNNLMPLWIQRDIYVIKRLVICFTPENFHYRASCDGAGVRYEH